MITIRASSLSDFLDCAHRAAARVIEGKTTPGGFSSIVGKAVHIGGAFYDQAKISNIKMSIDDAASAVVDMIKNPEEEIIWDDRTPFEAEKISLRLHNLYCSEIAPKYDFVAVETYCGSIEFEDLGFAISGNVDRIRHENGGYGINDNKTGKMVVSTNGIVKTQQHAAQIGIYEILAEHELGIRINLPANIVGLNVAQTEKGIRAGIGEMKGCKGIILGESGKPGVLEYVAQMLKTGMFPPNPRSQLCHPKYCPIYNECQFCK